MDRTDLVVVALPREGDYVRKISSEKEPHLTLLYLGPNTFDASQMEIVAGQVEHAASQLSPFTLAVEKRGELGDKNADVLFFGKEWSKDIALFRNHLLQNELIRKAYLIPEQYPSWTPHLTLGYPDNPAKKDPLDHREVTFVEFDRIALWVDDSVGPTFELRRPDNDMEVAMSQMERGRSAVDGLMHYGVKGMRWGVRRADAKFEKRASSAKVTFAVYNGAAERANKYDIDRINNMPKYRNADLSKPSKLQDQYHKEHQDAFIKRLHESAESLGTNASGTRKYGVVANKDGSWDVRTEEVKHEDSVIRVVPEYDENGFIVSISVVDDSLKHYGVKGMKWGVRRSEAQLDRASSGPKPRLSDDAKTAEKLHNKIHTSGTGTLTNQEMRQYLERMDLERRFQQTISTPTPNQQAAIDRGHNQVKKILSYGETIEKARKFLESPTGEAVKTGLKASAAAGFGYFTGGAGPAAAAGAGVVVRRMTR